MKAKKVIGSVVRTALAGVGMALVGAGIVDDPTAAQFVSANTAVIVGALGYLGAQVWSIKNIFGK